jgi:hypothetical protein
MSCYRLDPAGFTVGYARRDVPFMLGWHLKSRNPVAPLIRAEGFTFKSEVEWFRDRSIDDAGRHSGECVF